MATPEKQSPNTDKKKQRKVREVLWQSAHFHITEEAALREILAIFGYEVEA